MKAGPRISTEENTVVWGPVERCNKEFSDLLDFPHPRQRPKPGMLVSSYEGIYRHMQARGLDYLGLGVIVAVAGHPKPVGDTKYMCTVLWNWTE